MQHIKQTGQPDPERGILFPAFAAHPLSLKGTFVRSLDPGLQLTAEQRKTVLRFFCIRFLLSGRKKQFSLWHPGLWNAYLYQPFGGNHTPERNPIFDGADHVIGSPA